MEDMEGSTRHGGGQGSIAVISTLQLHYPYQDPSGSLRMVMSQQLTLYY